MQKKSLIYSTFILTRASILTRFIGFVYRIYMSNEIGAYGMGQYQLIMPVYMLSWSFICAGFTIAISKLVSQEHAKNQYGNMQKYLVLGTSISFAISLIFSFILYTFSTYIAVTFFDTKEISLPFKILSLSLPFMSIGSCIRGYFLGLQQPNIPSIAQVLEQFVRIGAIFFFISIYGSLTIEIAILGILFAEAIATVFIVLSYYLFKKKHKLAKTKSTVTLQSATSILLAMSLPIMANRVLGSFLQAYENILITQKLTDFGLSKESAIISLGAATGMAMPLIFFPTAVITSIGVSLVPAISSSVATNNYTKVKHLINRTLLFTSILGFAVAMLFMVFGYELSFLIYKQNLGLELFALSVSAPLIYIQMILSSTLNGLGLQFYTFINSIMSSIIAIVIIFIAMPTIGMMAFYLAIFLSTSFTVATNSQKIISKTGIKIDIFNILIKPLVVALATGLSTNLIFNNFKINNMLFDLLFFSFIMCLIYFVLCIVVGIITLKDINRVLLFIKPRGSIEKID